ncbi:MAG TPA: hypothetical protein VIK72_07830 [Clostridiaceae bacterium]
MNRFFKLSIVLFKNSLQVIGKKGKNSIIKLVLLFICLMMAFAPMVAGIIFFLWNGYDYLNQFNQAGAILSITLPVISFVIFFFGIFYVANAFFFSQDIENLLPLPFKPWEILLSKFVITLIYEYITCIILALPVILIYGIKSGGGVIYYLYSIIIFLTLPILPLVIATLIMIIIMRFTNVSRYKERFKLIGGILALFIGIGINIIYQRAILSSNSLSQILQTIAEGNNSIVNMGNSIFPTAKYASKALVYNMHLEGMLNMLLYLIIITISILIMVFLGEGMYFKGVMGVSETPAKRKKLSSEEFSRSIKQNSHIYAYAMKEMKLLIRTPIYFLNCILMNFIWPVFLLLPFITQKNLITEIKKMIPMITDPQYSGIVLAIVIAMGIFIFSTNGISASAISREGDKLYVCKYLPMDYRQQIIAKIVPALIMNFFGSLLLLIGAIYIFFPNIIIIFMIIILFALGALLISFLGILLDLMFPKLNWDSEQKAVKQNLNVAINLFIGCAIAGILVFIAFKFSLNLLGAFLVTGAIFATLDGLLYYVLSTQGVKLFKNMEN